MVIVQFPANHDRNLVHIPPRSQSAAARRRPLPHFGLESGQRFLQQVQWESASDAFALAQPLQALVEGIDAFPQRKRHSQAPPAHGKAHCAEALESRKYPHILAIFAFLRKTIRKWKPRYSGQRHNTDAGMFLLGT